MKMRSVGHRPRTFDDIFCRGRHEFAWRCGCVYIYSNHSRGAGGKEKDLPEETASRKPYDDFYRFEKLIQLF